MRSCRLRGILLLVRRHFDEVWSVDVLIVGKGTACYALSELAQKTGAKGSIQAKFNLKAGPVQLQYDVAGGHAKAAIPHDVYVTILTNGN